MEKKLKGIFGKRENLDLLLFVLSILVYSVTRLASLDDFPIYFLSDEAIHTVIAADLVRDAMWGTDGVFLPTYFENSFFYNLSLSVYLQVLPYILLGKSVFITRLIPVLFTISGSFAVGLTLKQIYKTSMWWSVVLFLTLTPAWFLHSRTALEVSLFVSFFAWFYYFYLHYRYENPRYLFPAVLSGALAFYSYNAAQIIIPVVAILFFVSDFNYHRHHMKIILGGATLSLITALPYVRFQFQHGGETYFHLRLVDSYLLHPIPVGEKALQFLRNYLTGLDPRYWYSPISDELSRHVMKGYGNILLITFPLAVLGGVLVLRHLRESKYRALLISLTAAPLGGTAIGIGITRVLVFIVPAAILTSLGLSILIELLTRKIAYQIAAVISFAIMSIGALYMTWDAVVNGPFWFDDYGLAGMQYGGPQLFKAVHQISTDRPETPIYVSPTWANGADVIKRFFIEDALNVQMANAAAFLLEPSEQFEEILFVLTPAEYEEALENPKVGEIEIEQTVPYPDGRPGFFLVRMKYSPQAADIFAAEREERLKPSIDSIDIGGEPATVEYPYLDMGEIQEAFDGDAFTMVRVYEAHPAIFRIRYSSPRILSGVKVTTGSMDYTLCVDVARSDTYDSIRYCETYKDLPDDPTVNLEFDQGGCYTQEIAVEFITQKPEGSFRLHVREIEPY